MKRIQFNTGRPYTEEGQIIVAEIDVANGSANFNDTSRMVYGAVRISYAAASMSSPFEIARRILQAYDHGSYEAILSSNAPRFDPNAEIISI